MAQTWEKLIKPIPILQWLIVIVLSTHVLVSDQFAHATGGTALFILVLLAGNLALLYGLPKVLPLSSVTTVLVILDTLLVPTTLFVTGATETDLFVVYFGIIMIAGASGNLKRALVLAAVTWAAYVAFMLLNEQESAPPEAILLRLPFFLVMTLFYGAVGEFAQHERADREKIEQQAKEIRRIFSSYVSPQIVEELIKDPSKAKLGGQRRELTMLFADLAGFTSFSEKRPAEEVVALLNEYLTAMTEVVFHWNGTLDKFVGDQIVVFWGAPSDQPNHVELAIKCALHMRDRLAVLQAKWRETDRPVLDNGIGINTGVVVVGNFGAEGKKMDYTMIGDHVNLAARVEGLTRRFKCPIVITEGTAARLKPLINLEDRGDNQGRVGHVYLHKLGPVRVRGKDQPVVVYGLTPLKRDEPSMVDEEPEHEAVEIFNQ